MPKGHRYVKGKGFTREISHEIRQETNEDVKPTDASKIKGLFGRKTIMVEWENTDTGEVIYIPIKQLLPGQLRMIGERIYGEPGLNAIASDKEFTEEDIPQLYKELGISTTGELMVLRRKETVEILMATIQTEELLDREWLMNEASYEFLETLKEAALGLPPKETKEDNSVSTFPEVDTKPAE